ncbi:MAG TPA: hypothetical protein VET87_16450, partial [Rubrivivax sp.]|nr:hypothetical protein [Rubrivivax sp.]
MKDTPACCPTARRAARVAGPACATVLAGLLAWPLAALAQAAATPTEGGLDDDTLGQIQALGQQASAGLAPGALRVEIEAGRLDPRLRLAPCARVEAHLPP